MTAVSHPEEAERLFRLQSALRTVACTRRVAEARAAELRAKREAFEESIAQEKALATAALDSQVEAEAEARRRALDVFALHPDQRKPHAGVEVKRFIQLDYDSAKALEWALEHRMCISLDRRAFEVIAKNAAVRPEWVEEREEYRVLLATDMDAALGVGNA